MDEWEVMLGGAAVRSVLWLVFLIILFVAEMRRKRNAGESFEGVISHYIALALLAGGILVFITMLVFSVYELNRIEGVRHCLHTDQICPFP